MYETPRTPEEQARIEAEFKAAERREWLARKAARDATRTPEALAAAATAEAARLAGLSTYDANRAAMRKIMGY